MKKQIIMTDNAPKPVGAYSQAVEANGMLYCSGQIPIRPATGELFTGPIQEQATIVMENIRAVLTAAGYSFSDVIKTAIFLTDMSDFSAVNTVYSKYFEFEPPARSCVAVSQLPKGVNVEIEVIAAK